MPAPTKTTQVALGAGLSAPGIAGLEILHRYDLVGPLPVWVLSLAFVLAVVASLEGLHERLAAGEREWQMWLRICLQAVLIAPSMYLSGWGSLIPILAFFPIAISQLRAYGSRTCYPVMAGATIVVVAGQGGIAAGVVPNNLPVLTAHSVAFVQLFATVSTIAYLSSMAKARETAESTLADRERRFRKLVHHSTDLIMLAGAGGHIQWVSPSVVTHLGRRPAELVGVPIGTLAGLGDGDLGDTLRVWAGRPDQPPLRLEWRLHRADGDARWYDVTIQNLLDDPDVAAVKEEMRRILDDIRSGEFTRQLIADDDAGRP
ncbi:PAS domain S-box protein, partial [Actinoplanes philippinensis]|uniref:PAS domain S-box protein n=1 Tax=Actinoplanes philippinensis TaxID=35752 RepID=UPI0033F927CE